MNRSNSALALIFIGLLNILFTIYPVTASPAVYMVVVDDNYGFYEVRNIEPGNISFKYVNNTLNINAGDNVIWENQADNNNDLTILSEQNLWDNKSGYLRYNYDTFNYTFKQPGTYQLYLKDEPLISPQTIVVAPLVETPTATTPSQTPTPTATKEQPVATTRTPGFESLLAISALLITVLIRRK